MINVRKPVHVEDDADCPDPTHVASLRGAACSTDGPIRPAGPSPRIQTLRQDAANDGPRAVENFWTALAREHTPIIEAIPSDKNQMLITLVWRGSPETKSVRLASSQMEHIPATDVWYITSGKRLFPTVA
jgi:hypothetical protein